MSGTEEPSAVQSLVARLRPVRLRRRGAALALWGEAGIGKSHTALEVLRLGELRTHSYPARTPLTDLILQLPRPRRLSLWAQTQLDLLQRGESPGQGEIRDLLCTVLVGLAPVTLLLEDLHELSPAQNAQVASLARAVTGLRGVALLVTSRQAPPVPFEPHHLGPLAEPAFAALLEAELQAPLPPEASRWLIQRARGNPLFGLESLRYLARQGHLWNDGQHWRWRPPPADWLPVTIDTLIERLLQNAAPTSAARSALEALALLPDEATPEQWSQVAGLTVTDLQSARTQLSEHGVLHEPDTLQRAAFSHPLYREVALRTMLPQVHRQLAHRAIHELRLVNPMAAAALVPSAGLEADVALDLLLEAAKYAQDAGMRGQAGRLLASASEAAVGERRAALALEAARALLRVDLPEAERLALLAGRDPAHEAQARWVRAEALASQGRLAEAERLVTQGSAASERLGPDPRPVAAQRLVLSMLALDIPRALALWRAHPELHASRDVAVLLAAVRALVFTRALTEARALLDTLSARTDLGEVDRLTLENQEAVLLLQSGELDAAAQRLDTLAPRLLAAGEGRAAAAVRHNQGVALERMGHYQEAVTQELEAARLYAAAGDQRGFASVRTAAAWNLWHFGLYEEAETLFLEAREVLRRSGHSNMLVECEGMLSLLYLDWSPPLAVDLAQRYAASALGIAREIQDVSCTGACLYDLAMVRMRQGRWAEALALTAEMQALCAEHGFQGLAVAALYSRALALEGSGEPEEALRLLRQTVQDSSSAGTVMFTRKIETEVARLSGDLELARSLLVWFEEHKLHNQLRILRAAFPGLGLPEPGRTAVELTGQEPVLEVLGPMRLRQGQAVQAVRGGRRRDLLAALLDARLSGRSQVSKLDLLDALYPGLPDVSAGSSLRDLVHQLRQLCGPGAVLTTPDGYALGTIGSDAEIFLSTGDLSMWRGPVWQDVTLAEELGETRSVLNAALQARAGELVDHHPGEAERLGRILIESDPYSLSSLRLLLSAMRASGHHTSLNRAYSHARERLREVGEDLPDAWSAFLAGRVGVLE
jgi:DNA-binding SARP family transcriptional activator